MPPTDLIDELTEAIRAASFDAPKAYSSTEWQRRIRAILEPIIGPPPGECPPDVLAVADEISEADAIAALDHAFSFNNDYGDLDMKGALEDLAELGLCIAPMPPTGRDV